MEFLIYTIILLFNIIYINANKDIKLLQVDKQYNLFDLKLNEELLYYVPIKDFYPEHIYKVMFHFVGPLGIDIKTKIICDDFHEISSHKSDLRLNDYTEYDFWTNKNRVPTICGDNYKYDRILISVTPYSITYQFKDEKEIRFNGILELVCPSINMEHRFFHMICIRKLYRLLGFVLIIPILMIIFRNEIRKFLIWVLDEKIDKDY